MKRRRRGLILILLLAIIVAVGMFDIRFRYDIDLQDFFAYNRYLTEEEASLVREKPIIVGIYDDPPLSFTNEFNNYNSGIVVDYLSQLAIETRSNINLKVRKSSSIIDALKSDEVDAIVLERTPENLLLFDFSQPLCVVKTRIVVPNTSGINHVRDLDGKKLVALIGDDVDGKVNAFFSGSAKFDIVEVDNIYQCFALIRNNEVSGFVGDDMEAAHFLNVTNKSAGFKFLDVELYEKEISLAVEKGNSVLLSVLNKGILDLKKKNLIAQTQYKWLGDFDTASIDLRTVKIAYNVLLAVLIIVGVFSSWNYIITQRVNTKTRELSESKEELRLIIDTMQSGIIVVENDTHIVECNDALTKLTGVSREALIGQVYGNIKALEAFADTNNANKVIPAGGSYFYVTRQKVAHNKQMIVIEDYTEKYLHEKQARQESKMIAVGQLSAGLAHEVRNPLGLIKSYIYVIEKHCTNEICEYAIQVINDSVNRINKLVENLLRFSRLSNDEVKPINVKEIVHSIIDSERQLIRDKDVAILNTFESQHSAEVVINEGVLRMAIQNLIKNSVDAFAEIDRPIKQISVSTIVGADEVRIRITDNGCGIGQEMIDNIFDPFYTTKDNGTGLGLYIVSTEIMNNNGTIKVESEWQQGTTFDIVLPIMG